MFKKILHFYLDVFRHPSITSKKLWILILIKLFIIFVVFRLFFFPDNLKKNFKNDSERAASVIDNLTK
jgi:hypothetical protein